MLSSQCYLAMSLEQDWRSPQRMHSMTACKLSSLNYQIKKWLFDVVTGMDTLEEKQLNMKVSMEVMGMVNVMQAETEYLTLLLQMTLSLGILCLKKDIVPS